ncbi:hypothetical protein [Actinomadura sp. 6N118]|uniref:hypothetical protein n=1 Tax=Actinomadura sp. 6N118 TaxID=3375151 RepID=UPI00379E19B1
MGSGSSTRRGTTALDCGGTLLLAAQRGELEGAALKTAGDRASHEWLMAEFAADTIIDLGLEQP